MPTRAEPSTLDEVYSFDGWSVFPPRGVLSRAGAEVHLAPPELRTLHGDPRFLDLLARRIPGRRS